MLEAFKRFNERVSAWAEWVGFGAVCLMVALTCIDVLGTKLFRAPVPGSVDIMMLAQLVGVTFAASMTLVRDRHVAVEFFVMLFPKRVQALLEGVAQLLCLGLFVVVAWRFVTHGLHLQAGGEQTATVRIPVAPFAYAAALAMVPVCLVLLQQFLQSIVKVVRDEP